MAETRWRGAGDGGKRDRRSAHPPTAAAHRPCPATASGLPTALAYRHRSPPAKALLPRANRLADPAIGMFCLTRACGAPSSGLKDESAESQFHCAYGIWGAVGRVMPLVARVVC